jgi:hypothetical protein
MGLFSSKTTVTVSSSVYNMAGDELDRPIFLKNLVIRNVLSGTKKGMGETITAGYLNGPGIKFRSFFRWANENYDNVGLPTGQMFAGDIVNTQTVANHVPAAAGESVWVQEASLADSDYMMWAEQWIIQNRPEDLNGVWEADMDDATSIITIVFGDTTSVSFLAQGFISGAKYVYAYYTVSEEGTEEPIVEGSVVYLAVGAALPDITAYSVVSTFTSNRDVVLDTVTTISDVFSDGRPDEGSTNTTSGTFSVAADVDVYDREEVGTADPNVDAMLINRFIRTITQNKETLVDVTTTVEDIEVEPGVTRTRTTTVNDDYLEEYNSYKDDTQVKYDTRWQPLDMWIYRIGTGIADLDNLVQETEEYGQFFPMIPVRLNNKFLSDITTAEVPNIAEIENTVNTAYRKGTDGGRYSDLVSQINESEDLADMDYVYVMYGVSLNVIDRSARRYIYEFMKRLMISAVSNVDDAQQFTDDMEAYRLAYVAWENWRDNPTSPASPEPALPAKPTLPQNEIKIQSLGGSGGLNINYDIRLSWNYITETVGVGKGKVGAKKNQLWLEMLDPLVQDNPLYTGQNPNFGPVSNGTATTEIMRIWWQYEDEAYRYMDIAGLVHKNYVYAGKHVTTTAKEALDDGEESGFIIPLHYATYKQMRLVDSTQMGTACVFLVFNVYEENKKKWWQSGFFQILLVIAVAIASVYFTGGAGFGVLGSHVAVGSTLGLTGMTAAIVGSVANALAAMVLSSVISELTEDMGVLGAVLGAVITMAVSGAMSSFSAGNGFKFDFSQLMKAENIMKLMNAAGQGYTAYARSTIIDLRNDLIEFEEEANTEQRRVREQFVNEFGYGGGQIDPMMFVSDNSPVIAESRDTFLSRTLMTGSDVAAMSRDLLNDYVELNLTLPNAFT